MKGIGNCKLYDSDQAQYIHQLRAITCKSSQKPSSTNSDKPCHLDTSFFNRNGDDPKEEDWGIEEGDNGRKRSLVYAVESNSQTVNSLSKA